MSDEQPIRLRREGKFAVLTMCRPDLKNAVTPDWIATLHAHADELHNDLRVKAVLLNSEGPMFCVGADVKAMGQHLDDLPTYIDSLIRPAHEALLRLVSLPVPVVGLLRGTAAGGGASLALACDLLLAARSARLAFAYPKLGTTPDMGLSHSLIERLGRNKAFQVYLLSEGLNMDEAKRLGLVQQVFDDQDSEDGARRLVDQLTSLPATASKSLFLKPQHEELAAQLERERAAFLACCRSDTFRKRVTAFTAKR